MAEQTPGVPWYKRPLAWVGVLAVVAAAVDTASQLDFLPEWAKGLLLGVSGTLTVWVSRLRSVAKAIEK